jgi:outer membrane immunogenic protein
MNKFVSALALGVSSTIGATAFAADVGIHDWSGFSAGVAAGLGNSKSDWNGVAVIANGTAQPFSNSLGHSGGSFSAYLGYNMQNANIVYGGEVDYGTLSASKTVQLDGAEGHTVLESKPRSLGSARFKLGYAVGDALFYGTAGVAFGQLKNTYTAVSTSSSPSTIVATDVTPHGGWVGGAGAEYALSQNLSLRVEGLYYGFGSKSASLSARNVTDTVSIRSDVFVGRVGLGYKF